MEKFKIFSVKSFEHNAPSWLLIISEMETSQFSSHCISSKLLTDNKFNRLTNKNNDNDKDKDNEKQEIYI